MAENPISQRDFLSALWGPDNFGVAELTLITKGIIKATPFAYPADLDKLIETANQNNGQFNVYMGICLRREKWPRKSGRKNHKTGEDEQEWRGTRENALSSMCFWADIDFAGLGHKGKTLEPEIARKMLAEFPCKPSIIVKSGGGIQVYWMLKEPAVSTELRQIEAINAAIAKHFGCDSVGDGARIFRFPGCLNIRYSPPRLAEISFWHPERTYTLDDFDILSPVVEPLPDPSAAEIGTPSATGNGAAPAAPSGPQAVPSITLPSEVAAKIGDLLSKIWLDGFRHDLALYAAGMLAHAGVSEDSAWEVISRASDLAGGETGKRKNDVKDTYQNFCMGAEVRGATSIEKEIIESKNFPEIARPNAKKILSEIIKYLPKPSRQKKNSHVDPNFKVVKVIKFDSRPARYTAKIKHDCGEEYDVPCETKVFKNFYMFREAFFEETPNRSLNMIKQSLWEDMISPEKTTIEIRPAPEEATAKGTIQVELESFLDNKKENPEPGELKSFPGYTDKEVFFTLNAFRTHLKATGIAKLADREIVHIIRNDGWIDAHRRIAGRSSRLWVKEIKNGEVEVDSGSNNASGRGDLFKKDEN